MQNNEKGIRLFTLEGVTINNKLLEFVQTLQSNGDVKEKNKCLCENALNLASLDLLDQGLDKEFFSLLRDLNILYNLVESLTDPQP